MVTTMSGNAVMNPRAAAVIAARPTEASSRLIFSDPVSAKNDATLAGSWLHQAAVYRVANSFIRSRLLGAHSFTGERGRFKMETPV